MNFQEWILKYLNNELFPRTVVTFTLLFAHYLGFVSLAGIFWFKMLPFSLFSGKSTYLPRGHTKKFVSFLLHWFLSDGPLFYSMSVWAFCQLNSLVYSFVLCFFAVWNKRNKCCKEPKWFRHWYQLVDCLFFRPKLISIDILINWKK